MTFGHLVWRTLRHYRGSSLAVIAGLAVATAVITGSLVIGTSLRGSLLDLTLARLGSVNHAAVLPRPISDQIVSGTDALALLRTTGTATPAQGEPNPVGVTVWGVDAGFVKLQSLPALPDDGVLINAALARDLQVRQGDEIALSVNRPRAIGMDSRIGPKFLNASVGFGGSCFKKDILNLAYICRNYGLDAVADYWESVVDINEYQKERFILGILNAMFNTLAGKRICLFGFAFKADTRDTRETPAFTIARRLVEEKADLIITDPKALDNAKIDLADLNGITYEPDPYKAALGCDALAVMTEWKLYTQLDYNRIYESMAKPAFIFDGRNILNHKLLHTIGFNVYPIGKPPLVHF